MYFNQQMIIIVSVVAFSLSMFDAWYICIRGGRKVLCVC